MSDEMWAGAVTVTRHEQAVYRDRRREQES
ncbi:MAG: hypothetical protein JWQ95_4699 [Sphaerisporangium sp.]|jgi:hypothetical protein|nr:hypothetical protein [Sphaerisporangium sp.]